METIKSKSFGTDFPEISAFSSETRDSHTSAGRRIYQAQKQGTEPKATHLGKGSFSQILEQVAQPVSSSPEIASRQIIGSMIARYQIDQFLGAGGMGWIFRARDTLFGNQVAIKMLPADKQHDPKLKKLLLNEARCALLVNHPNVVSTISLEDDDDTPVLVMELVEGKFLRRAVNEQVFSERQTLKIAAQVACGLAAIHSAGVVHRDLKPENIMLTHTGSPKIIDFGIAWDGCFEKNKKPQEKNSDIAGTPRYMAPEQRAGEQADSRSDIYAFGAVLYEMTTGKTFSDGDSLRNLNPIVSHAKTVSRKPESFSLWGGTQVKPNGLSDKLQQVLSTCLAYDPVERYADGAELVNAMQAL